MSEEEKKDEHLLYPVASNDYSKYPCRSLEIFPITQNICMLMVDICRNEEDINSSSQKETIFRSESSKFKSNDTFSDSTPQVVVSTPAIDTTAPTILPEAYSYPCHCLIDHIDQMLKNIYFVKAEGLKDKIFCYNNETYKYKMLSTVTAQNEISIISTIHSERPELIGYIPMPRVYEIHNKSNYCVSIVQLKSLAIDLASLIKCTSSVPVNITRKILFDVVNVMNILHTTYFAHLNLTLSNIYLVRNDKTEEFSIQLTNFENAIIGERNLIEEHADHGNSEYSCGKNPIFPRTRDIYSIGVILFRLLLEDINNSEEFLRILRLNNKWRNRDYFDRNFKKKLKSKGCESEEINYIKSLLEYLFEKENTNIGTVRKFTWFTFSKSTSEEILNHLSKL